MARYYRAETVDELLVAVRTGPRSLLDEGKSYIHERFNADVTNIRQIWAESVSRAARPDTAHCGTTCSPSARPGWHRRPVSPPLRSTTSIPLRPAVSGAALNVHGSPLSGGYAGAKATQRFIAGYAQDAANRAGLGIAFTTVLPYFAPLTGVGWPAVRAYAARAGQSVEDFLAQSGSLVTPEIAGTALVELVQADAATVAPSYRLSGAGLQKLP